MIAAAAPVQPASQRRELFGRAARFTLLAALVIALTLRWRGDQALPTFYYFDQDLPLLLISASGLWWMARAEGASLSSSAPRWRWLAVAGMAMLAWGGGHWLLGRYPVARDEFLAEFAATYLARGQLGMPIPPALRPFAEGAMPLWSNDWIAQGYWVSGYLPVNSAIRAAFAWAGDPRLAGPALLAIGAAAIWSSARRVWPEAPQAAVVALVLALTSAQVIANAMTPYAMTAHFALNALWLACFIRGGRTGHGAALAIGAAACGLHQLHFHLMFVSGFLLWMWRTDRRGLALLYAAACLGYVALWSAGYPRLLLAVLGEAPGAPGVPETMTATTRFWLRIQRLAQLEPVTGITRFVAWQNVLLVPLTIAGMSALKDSQGRPTLLWACAVSCAFGLATVVFQGHGYGYRYLNGMIPAFCMLAAGGWLTLERRGGMPGVLLWGSAAIALFVTVPFALWRSERFIAPYAAAQAAARAAPAEVVLVDTRAGAFLQDIVRYEGKGPLILDVPHVPPALLRRLCATRRVRLFAEGDARASGIGPAYYVSPDDAVSADRRALLERIGCTAPVLAQP